MEYRDTGWYDVECTKDGKFVRNGRKLTPFSCYGYSPMIRVKIKGQKPKQIAANKLIAKAWMSDYVEGCNIIPIDGNPENMNIDNLHVADEYEFASYRAERRKNPKAGVEDLGKYGLFKKTPIQGLECTINGVFKRNNRIVNLQEGKRFRDGLLYIQYKDGKGNQTTTTAARLVAQTWSPDIWFEDCVIQYKDGNSKNIHSENLILVDAHKFHKLHGQMTGKGNMCDFSRAKECVEKRAKEAMIAYRYFQTGKLDEFNEYVKHVLIPYINDCIDKYGYRPNVKRKILPEILSILYDWVLCNRPLTSYSLFCKKLVRTFMKEHNYGIYNIQPKPIARDYVSQLNIDSLCERYRSMKIKRQD